MKFLKQSLVLGLSFLLVFAPPAYAATLSNDTFILQTKDINLQQKTSSVIQQSPSTRELLPKPFSFSLSTTLVDFGEITPTDPTTRTTTIRISSPDISGFSLFALTDHELQAENKKIIPDTTCDNGLCNHSYASAWDSILTYGLGFRCEPTIGFDCQSRFTQNSDFMQLPNQAKGHALSPIILGNTQKQETQTTITYKTNISTTQDIGIYKNILQIIAVPDF